MSFNKWTVKERVVDPHRGTLLSNKKEWTIDINNLDESPRNYAEQNTQSQCQHNSMGKVESFQ